jgi:hypothetical protein
MTFSKEHQTDACQFDASSKAKVALHLSFSSRAIFLFAYLHPMLRIIMLASRTKLMSSGGESSNLG